MNLPPDEQAASKYTEVDKALAALDLVNKATARKVWRAELHL